MDAFQDNYAEEFSNCYGCGSKNEHGYKIKSRWDGDESVTYYKPRPDQCSMPGFVYGGLIASLMDCHGTGTAAAAATAAFPEKVEGDTLLRYVTASLTVDFLKPTPIAPELEIRGKVEELTERKAIIIMKAFVDGELCAKGKVVAVPMPETMLKMVGGG